MGGLYKGNSKGKPRIHFWGVGFLKRTSHQEGNQKESEKTLGPRARLVSCPIRYQAGPKTECKPKVDLVEGPALFRRKSKTALLSETRKTKFQENPSPPFFQKPGTHNSRKSSPFPSAPGFLVGKTWTLTFLSSTPNHCKTGQSQDDFGHGEKQLLLGAGSSELQKVI